MHESSTAAAAGLELGRQARAVLEYDRVLQLIAEYAVSPGGARRVLALAPATDPQWIGREFDRLEEMVGIATGEANFRPSEVPLLDQQVLRLTKPGAVLEGREIVAFGRLFEAAEAARRYILRREDSLPALAGLARRLEPFADLAREITRVFDENAEVRSSASPVLSRLRQDSLVVRGRIEKKLRELTDRLKLDGTAGENFTTLRQERYVLAVRRDELHSVPGIIQGESGSGNTLFIEPEPVVQLNNRLREIEMDIRREIMRILAELTALLAQGREALEEDLLVLAELDSLFARARYAEDYHCTRPALSRDGALRLVAARHPLLLHRVGRDRQQIVPFTLELEPGERTLLVSGPNAGGKTVLLKTAGLVALMAQSGIFPPAEPGTELPVFEALLSAIGDEQSIENDLSTFSGHVLDLKTALEDGHPGSLVLLDEIGVGTDPTEGAALAAAVLERLTRLGCLTLCTTHFGELKLLPEVVPGLVNGSLEFDPGRMRPTFLFRKGLPGQSYGLVIARNMGLSERLLDRAREFMKGETVNIAAYLERLEQQQQELSRRLLEADNCQARLAASLDEAVRREEQLAEREREQTAREREFRRQLEEQRRRHLLEARREVEEVIARLEREYSATAGVEAARIARKSLEERISELGEAARREALSGEEAAPAQEREGAPRVGEPVRIPALGLEGEVVEGPDSGGRYVVLVGRARITMPGADLVPLKKRGRAARARVSYDLSGVSGAGGDAPPAGRLDLRGMRAEEVEQQLDRFLSEVTLGALEEVVVVHGKGTGALRARVAELLAADRRVESFRAGAWNEGGTGATIVRMRKD